MQETFRVTLILVVKWMLHIETPNPRHTRLAVIADDITGAFDTGVQFSKRGASVRVTTAIHLGQEALDADVLVIDAETRHLTSKAAYAETYRLVRSIVAWNIPHLYIKTDSGLRGNIGPALKAALDATGETLAAFAPAYPDMRRITRGGQQWIDGKPLQESVFGRDLFEPVRASRISELLTPYGLRVCECGAGTVPEADAPIVAVYDAASNEDFLRIAEALSLSGNLRITAGCAAFAAALPSFFGLPDSPVPAPAVHSPLLIVCGSLNPITRRQFEYGERIGYTRLVLTRRQLLEEGYLDSEEGRRWFASLEALLRRRGTLMLDTGLGGRRELAAQGASALNKSELGRRIALQLGAILLRLLSLEGAQSYTPMMIGGDTLMGFLAQFGATELTLEGEVSLGVVMFSAMAADRKIRMLSKSGGFGTETLLGDVITQEPQGEVNDIVCM